MAPSAGRTPFDISEFLWSLHALVRSCVGDVKRALLISVCTSLLLVVLLIVVGEPGRWPAVEPVPYQGEAAAVGRAGHADIALQRLIREPQNTWSNLSFIVGGALLCGLRRSRLARALGVPLIAVGVGSFVYHASASAQLRPLDVGAMYWLFLMVLFYCATLVIGHRRGLREPPVSILLGATLLLATVLVFSRNAAILGVKPLSLNAATGVTSAVLLLSLADTARRSESVATALQFLGIVTLFGAAVFLQLSDRPGGKLYRPDAFIQAHAAWHILIALAFVWTILVLDGVTAVAPPDSAARERT